MKYLRKMITTLKWKQPFNWFLGKKPLYTRLYIIHVQEAVTMDWKKLRLTSNQGGGINIELFDGKVNNRENMQNIK